MLRWNRSLIAASVAAVFATPALGRAQDAAAEAVASWIGLDAPTGREATAMQIIQQALPGWTRDSLGDLVLRRGKGRPRRVVACAIDAPSFAVSEITDDGYLRLHAAGNWRRSPLWEQSFEGQRVRIVPPGGWLPASMAVRSTHLWRGRMPSDAPATVEDLWVDAGVRSRAEAAALGVNVLDGVVRDWPAWTFAGVVSGPWASGRAGCAAVAAAAATASATTPKGETIFAITVQGGFDWAGLGAVVSAAGEVDTLVIAAAYAGRADTVRAAGAESTAVTVRPIPPPFGRAPLVRATLVIAPRARFAGALAETLTGADAQALAVAVARAAGVAGPRALPALGPRVRNDAIRADSLAVTASLMSTLTRVYAVSGHEGPMRDAVMRLLPAWAKAVAQVDSAGNVIVAAGPERDPVVFIAHMDEIGFTVASIAKDGAVTLANRGGFFRSLWEGQPALLHPPTGEPLRGLFVPRATATTKQPGELTAWFGLDSAALAAHGVAVGANVTGVKTPSRLAASRFTARSIDDRAGCAALLLALATLDPKALAHQVFFVFSTREEIGLEGAAAFAADHPSGIRRVYAVDTFVSSDSPLENKRFAYAPLGAGAVARALDNSSVTPPDELARLVRIAAAAGIPFQVGTTNGGNDGSEFVRYGVPDVAIAWPLRYAHSPAEVIDLADVLALGRVVSALAVAP